MTPIVQPGQIAASSKDIITFSGANSTWSDATYYYALFTASGSFTIDGYLVFQSLLVGGGGGGGNFALAVSGTVGGIGQGGGGGGGSVGVDTNIRGTGVWTVTVGAGGAAQTNGGQTRIESVSDPSLYVFENGGVKGNNGVATIGSIATPLGGDGGGPSYGGLSHSSRSGGLAGSVYQYDYYSPTKLGRVASGGGGAGAGSNGSAGNQTLGGAGGSAYTVASGGWVTSTGSQFSGGAGGAGGAYLGFPLSNSPFHPVAGAANSGNGGGGGAAYFNPSGPSASTRGPEAGGSGYAVIRYTRVQVGG